MKNWNDYSLRIGNLKIPHPIIQGGMGIGISMSGLAAAVANEGGVGVISAAGIGLLSAVKSMENNALALAEEIKKARQRTKGVLGVNIMVALSDFNSLVKAAIAEKIDIIFSGAGLALTLPSFLTKGSKTKLVPIISSGKAAKTISAWWKNKYGYTADAFVVEGPLAGGHLGFKPEQLEDPSFSLENLYTEVRAVTDEIENESGKRIPIIVGGGIFSGSEIKKFLELGADGVQMATRFVATEECDAGQNFKNAYIGCKKEDIKIIQSPVGLPGRAIGGDFLQKCSNGEKIPMVCPFHCLKTCKPKQSPYCISIALLNACKGKFENGFAFIGAKGYLVDKIISVKELFFELKSEFGG